MSAWVLPPYDHFHRHPCLQRRETHRPIAGGHCTPILKDVEIILVDSGSTDRTLEIASQYPVRVVHIQPQDFTFGYSLNQGITASHGELIVIASAHVYPVYPDWLECLLAPFATHR